MTATVEELERALETAERVLARRDEELAHERTMRALAESDRDAAVGALGAEVSRVDRAWRDVADWLQHSGRGTAALAAAVREEAERRRGGSPVPVGGRRA